MLQTKTDVDDFSVLVQEMVLVAFCETTILFKLIFLCKPIVITISRAIAHQCMGIYYTC